MANGSMTIALTGLRLFADHGLYAEELKTGNEFELDVFIDYDPPGVVISSLPETVDYVEAYKIVKSVFHAHEPLLETSAMKIADALYDRFPLITRAAVSIRKITPVLTNFIGSLGVTYTRVTK